MTGLPANRYSIAGLPANPLYPVFQKADVGPSFLFAWSRIIPMAYRPAEGIRV